MDNIITGTMSTGLYHSIVKFLTKTKEKNIIIDPFSCLTKLSLLAYQKEGTKISIIENKILFNNPDCSQGFIRFLYGDNREDLHNLFNPIQKSVEWYWDPLNNDIKYLFNKATNGLNILKKSYNQYATIQHTIDYYISILISKKRLISVSNQELNRSQTFSDNELSKLQQEDNNINQNKNFKKNKTFQNNKNENHKNENNKNENNKNENHKNENNKNENNKNENQKVDRDDERDTIQLFLKNLWNAREIEIIISLFKEYESKKDLNEKNYIFNSIINYCLMKENKLNTFLEEKSSILK